jgi:hypothetical protein
MYMDCTGAAECTDARERPLYMDVQVPRSAWMHGSGHCTWTYRCREVHGRTGAACLAL